MIRSFQMSVVEFLNVVEEPLKDKHLPLEKGKTIYTSLLGTAADLTPMDNVKASVSVSLSPFGSSLLCYCTMAAEEST